MKRILLVAIALTLALQLAAAEKVSDFKLEDINGKQVKLSDYQEKGLVIIDFWATWCVPCKKSLPKMNELHEKYDEVTVLAICTDKPRKKSKAIALVKSNRFSFETLFDSKKVVQKQFNITSIPRAFIVDQDGTIIYEHTGYKRGDEKYYEKVINKWIKAQKSKVPEEKVETEIKPSEEKEEAIKSGENE